MDEQIRLIAQRIGELRRISGDGAGTVARACGVGEEDYGLYERGERDIPVGVLHSIARYFQVELTALLTGENPHLHSISITRGGRGMAVNRRAPYKYQSLAYGFAGRRAEPFLVAVEPGPEGAEPELNTHPGQEFNYVLKGRIRLFFEGREYLLEEGDSAYFDAKKPHGMQAAEGRAEFLAVIF